MSDIFDVVVVGGGQAGLGVGYFLEEAKLTYQILERGRVGETWRSQRWDSFALNTPNWSNSLPGMPYKGPAEDGFMQLGEVIDYFQGYADTLGLAVRQGVTVTHLGRRDSGPNFFLETRDTYGETDLLEARCVVIASGSQNSPKIPPIQYLFPENILQLHTSTYRNPESLPEGAVLVVGSGQSGCQIVEDILPSGRPIYLCTSRVGRAPRRYRGREILEWWRDMGFWDVAMEDLEDSSVVHMRQPQISGVGRYGHTVSLQHLARQGVTLLGTLRDLKNASIVLEDNAAEHVAFGDEISARLKEGIDEYLIANDLELPPLVDDPADEPDPFFECVPHIEMLDIEGAEIRTVIWATGFTGEFDWIDLPVLDSDGQPLHRRGISPQPGLYFLGFPWLHKRKSGVIYGIEDDAGYLTSRIQDHLNLDE